MVQGSEAALIAFENNYNFVKEQAECEKAEHSNLAAEAQKN